MNNGLVRWQMAPLFLSVHERREVGACSCCGSRDDREMMKRFFGRVERTGRGGRGAALRRMVLAAGVSGLAVAGGPAWAACTDVARPGVEWRRCYHDGRNLQGVDLSGATLRDTSFQRANLAGANLREVSGFRVRFVSADMQGADLTGAEMSEADFTKADLSGAVLKDAFLRRARFFRTILRGADLTGADLEMVDLLHADLSGATWIDGERVCADDSIGQCN